MDPVDIIGDVHGCAEKLIGLLEVLGYENPGGAFVHPDRTVIFIGDLIDRGPEQIEVLDVVRAMVETGSAKVLMGNHEFNAISYRKGLRRHSEKNKKQHKEFLDQVEERPGLYEETIEWFKTLPLWIDLGPIRVVHACWDEVSMNDLANFDLSDGAPLPDRFFVEANTKDTPTYLAVETLLKGPEVPLGSYGPYLDKEDVPRHQARIKWWQSDATTLRELALIPANSTTVDGAPLADLPNEPVQLTRQYLYQDDVPVFFGHYWFTEPVQVLSPTAACVDYSAVKGGPLVAYRWEGESVLLDDHFVMFTNEAVRSPKVIRPLFR
jgi:hypothetical protein